MPIDKEPDTAIHLELGPEALGDLLRARPARVDAVVSIPSQPQAAKPPLRTPVFTARVALACVMAALLTFAGTAVRRSVVKSHPTQQTASRASRDFADVAHSQTGVNAPSPVRFTNPFDRSEVFEFPPGTSHDAAHALVADLLLKRARDRHIAYAHRPRTRGRRATARVAALSRSSSRLR
jgi:hypothetical protein